MADRTSTISVSSQHPELCSELTDTGGSGRIGTLANTQCILAGLSIRENNVVSTVLPEVGPA